MYIYSKAGRGELTGKCWTYKIFKGTRNFSWIATSYDVTRSYNRVSEEENMAVNKMPQTQQYLHERRELMPTAFLFLITSPCRRAYLYNFRHVNILRYEVALFSDRQAVFITRGDLITQSATHGHKVRASLVQRMTANSMYSQNTQ